MNVIEGLQHAFDEIRGVVHATARDLAPEHLTWRPDPTSNSIAWLLWHLSRVQDDHVAEIAGGEQVWLREGWARRFGLPLAYVDTGYGHAPDDVAAIRPDAAGLLVTYHDQVHEQTRQYLDGVREQDLQRVIDRSYDPPVTVGVRLLSVVGDDFQHAGQAAYLRGLAERALA